MKVTVEIGALKFKTKKEAEAYVRDLLNKVGYCTSVKSTSPENFSQFIELVKRHPKHVNFIEQMVDFSIVTPALNPMSNFKELNVIKSDGTREIISWKSCVAGKTNTSSRSELMKACRFAITDQILDFRLKNPCRECEFCKLKITFASVPFHVDHINHFVDIVDNFFNVSGYEIPNNFDIAQDGTQQRMMQNKEMETDFKKYHEKHAKLRYLCMTCNCKRGRRRTPSECLAHLDGRHEY